MEVENNGGLIAKNITVWTGLDAGNNRVYDDKFSSFNLSSRDRRSTIFQLRIPRGVHTRVVIWIYGDNFEVIKGEGDWFDT